MGQVRAYSLQEPQAGGREPACEQGASAGYRVPSDPPAPALSVGVLCPQARALSLLSDAPDSSSGPFPRLSSWACLSWRFLTDSQLLRSKESSPIA